MSSRSALTSDPDESGPFTLGLRLTAVLLLLRAQGPIDTYVGLIGLASLALLLPRALTTPAIWYLAAALLARRIVWDWPLADNHIYLMAYWCLAIGLALGSTAPAAVLARAGRWLLGAAFALAVVWKGLLSPDYVDGRFFRTTLVVDARFEDVVRMAGGMTREDLARHRDALVPLGEGAELADDDMPVEPPAFRRLALTLTWGGLIAEAALAIAFLAPLPPARRAIRHVLLLAFCAVTYPVAPVAGFGWLLLAMGASQAPPGRAWTVAYVATWLLVLAGTELPWAGWVADALGQA